MLTLFLRALRLKCPLCGTTKLVTHWLPVRFTRGCETCDYKFEREPGYYWGQSMMITYPFLGVLLMAAGGYAVVFMKDISAYRIALALACLSVPLGYFSLPHGRAIWIAMDLYFRPPEKEDKLQ